MDTDLLSLLRCQECGADLDYVDPQGGGGPHLRCRSEHHAYPVVNGIPRFVNPRNYAGSFGFQWRAFSKIQLDSYNGSGFSEERFKAITGWGEHELKGKLVLDAGCGAGRFAEVVIAQYKANLVAFDLSEAVDVCRENLGPHRPLICQASIYETPFKDSSFDFVYCIGVIQHTHDPAGAIRSLCKLVKPGGQIALWIYELNWKSRLGTAAFRYALRPIICRLPVSAQLGFCSFLVDVFYPLVVLARQSGLAGKFVMRMLPLAAAHLHSVKLRPVDLKTWMLLDTFDMYTPVYDKPQRYSSIVGLLTQQGFDEIRRHPHGAISVTATRKQGLDGTTSDMIGTLT